jgi:hypothetical protein
MVTNKRRWKNDEYPAPRANINAINTDCNKHGF